MEQNNRSEWAARIIAVIVVIMIALAVYTAVANAHYYAGCKANHCKKHVIRPYEGMFYSIASCESHHNLRAIGGGGKYRGLYQFDFPAWYGSGGHGDPINYGYTEQTYRAVIWLHRNGRQSWPNC